MQMRNKLSDWVFLSSLILLGVFIGYGLKKYFDGTSVDMTYWASGGALICSTVALYLNLKKN